MSDETKAPHCAEHKPLGLCKSADDPCTVCRGISSQRIMRSDVLLQGQRVLLILHHGEIYRLLQTRNDKLILQK